MMSYIIILACFGGIVLGLTGYWKLKQAQAEIEALFKERQELNQKIAQQAGEIIAKSAEVKHAQIRQKYQAGIMPASSHHIDEQLQQQGWFRDAPARGGVGLSGLQPHLSKPSRHGGDQAADSDSQSDTSGNL
ncbi:hypothetical protein A4G20_05590 [Pasteurellaceae bacterium RH1A]|nr:hypothetical protein A4G20_05590 [Pasteurellaceae bacterium RH1A]